MSRLAILSFPVLLATLVPGSARADEPPIAVAGSFTVDIAAVTSGGSDHRLRALTNLDLTAEADLGRLVGWHGARGFVYVLDNRGGRPNDAAGTLEGVDNIEVPRTGTRLFEAWIEQDLGRGASLKGGLIDLNSEFYASDSASLLIGPPFGIGSELAATGSGGPSIFPSSALALRLNVPLADGRGYVRAGVFNARAQTFGDPGGIDLSFREGLLVIAEGGTVKGRLRLSLGAWAYTRQDDDLSASDAMGLRVRRKSRGIYGLAEADLVASDARTLTAFARGGVSDGRTGPFSGSFDAGLRLRPVFDGRAESDFSIGFHQAWNGAAAREATMAAGLRPATEQVIELTYADRIGPHLTVQPDVQWIRRPGGLAAAPDALVSTLRLTLAF